MRRKSNERTTFEISDRRLKASLPAEQASLLGAQIGELLSPFVEGAGLIGDYIRFFRQKSALKAIKRVRELAQQQSITLRPVPPKFLLPWIESVSLESDDDQQIMEIWSNVLLNASQTREPCRPIFIDILKKIGSSEAIILERMWKPFTEISQLRVFLEISLGECDQQLEKCLTKILTQFENTNRKPTRRKRYIRLLDRCVAQYLRDMRNFGLEPTRIEIGTSIANKIFYDVEKRSDLDRIPGTHRPSVELFSLAALQLLGQESHSRVFPRERVKEETLGVRFFHLSNFGVEFMRACSGTRQQEEPG